MAMETMNESLRREMNQWLRGMDINLHDAQWEQIEFYLRELEAYNQKTNLTADTGETLLRRHAADGLVALPALRRIHSGIPAPHLLDLGAGGGFVGISIKIAWPEASVVLMESSQRKFQFLNWVSARLKLPELKVMWRRGEEGSEKFDSVLARALAPLPEAIRLAMPLVKESGAFIAYQTSAPLRGDSKIQKALDAESADITDTIGYRLPQETSNRHLLILKHRSENEPA